MDHNNTKSKIITLYSHEQLQILKMVWYKLMKILQIMRQNTIIEDQTRNLQCHMSKQLFSACHENWTKD